MKKKHSLILILCILTQIAKNDLLLQSQLGSNTNQIIYSLNVHQNCLSFISMPAYSSYAASPIIMNISLGNYECYEADFDIGVSNLITFQGTLNLQNGVFILVNSSNIIQYTNKFFDSIEIYTNPSILTTQIVDVSFGQFQNQIYYLTKENISDPTAFYKITKQSGFIIQAQLALTLPITNQFDKIICKNDIVFLCFQTAIYIYSPSSNVSSAKNISISNTSLNYTDIATNGIYFVYSVNNNITVIQLTNYTVIYSVLLTQNIIGVSLTDIYLVATTPTQIYQIDYQAKVIINYITLINYLPFQIYYLAAQNHFILFPDKSIPYNKLAVYKFTTYYNNCTNGVCTCAASYTLNLSDLFCYKNVPKAQQQRQKSIWQQILNSTALNVATDVFGKTMTFTSSKIAPTFLLSFTGFLDDIWFYQYHRYTYPESVQFFTRKVDYINQLRLNPWFLNSIQLINRPLFCNQSNQNLYQYLNFNSTDPQGVYFVHSAQDTYKNNLILNVLILIILKLLCIILIILDKRIKKKNNDQSKIVSLRTVIDSLRHNSRWWCILIACLESNMLKLTFNCFIQVLLPSSFQFFDKFNLILSFFFLFMLLLYCFCFYPLIYSLTKHYESRAILTRTNHRFESFYFQCFYIVFRNFIRSFIHSIFILNYNIQITLLTVIDIFFLILVFKMIRLFKYRIIAYQCVFYSFVFVLFDLYFTLLINTQIDFIQNLDKQLISLVLTFLLGGTALLTSFTILCMNAWLMIKQIVFNSKVVYFFEENVSTEQKQKQCILMKRKSQVKKKSQTFRDIKLSPVIQKCNFEDQILQINKRANKISQRNNMSQKSIQKTKRSIKNQRDVRKNNNLQIKFKAKSYPSNKPNKILINKSQSMNYETPQYNKNSRFHCNSLINKNDVNKQNFNNDILSTDYSLPKLEHSAFQFYKLKNDEFRESEKKQVIQQNKQQFVNLAVINNTKKDKKYKQIWTRR